VRSPKGAAIIKIVANCEYKIESMYWGRKVVNIYGAHNTYVIPIGSIAMK